MGAAQEYRPSAQGGKLRVFKKRYDAGAVFNAFERAVGCVPYSHLLRPSLCRPAPSRFVASFPTDLGLTAFYSLTIGTYHVKPPRPLYISALAHSPISPHPLYVPHMTGEYPSEVLEAIAYAVYLAAEPQLPSNLDPILTPLTPTPAPTGLTSPWLPPSWSKEWSRRTLESLCTVSRAFFAAARPYVWRRAQIRLPRGWMSLVSEITGGEDVVDESVMDLVEHSLDVAARSLYTLTTGAKEPDHGGSQFDYLMIYIDSLSAL